MRIAMMATGGVGGFLAAKLLEAKAAEVAVIARGRHLEAIRSDGLVVETPERTMVVRPDIATADPAEVGPVDFVVFAVKLPDTERAAEAIKPMLGPNTGVVPFQNGVESTAILQRIVGSEHAMGGVCYISSTLVAPGKIRQTGTFARFLFAEADGVQSERSRALRERFGAAGIEAPIPQNVGLEVWKKFAFLSSLAGMTAAARMPVSAIRAEPEMRAALRRAIAEVVAVAQAKGIALPDDTTEVHMGTIDRLPPDMRASQAHDLAAGKPLELEGLSGAVVRLGRETGVDTPVHQALLAVLRPYVNGASGTPT